MSRRSLIYKMERFGLKPEDVDYIAFDHLHVQDPRMMLGTEIPPSYIKALYKLKGVEPT